MNDKQAEIRIGTSGYSFEDWKGTFYPKDIDKGKMLDYYIRFFPTVEINSTYYRIPHPAVMANIVKKAPDGFDFMVKVPQSFTHRRSDLEDDVARFREAIKPFEESGKLSGLLAQFPYSFKFSPDSLDYIAVCRDAVAPNELFVEFRHNGWVNRQMYDRLKAEAIGYVCVDEPQLPGLLNPDLFATTNTAYVRLHGRNKDQWWGGGPLRYDYSYSDEELKEWKEKLEKIKSKVARIYIYFNNCHLGQATANATRFSDMLGL
ncbi:MAG: DUF72 domain-containing protein [Candidatus Zixiibacteriota bacterium]